MGQRRRRHKLRTPMAHRHWLVREHGGAPGWVIIAAALVVAGMLAYAMTHAA